MSTKLSTEYPKDFNPNTFNEEEIMEQEEPKMPIPPQQATEISSYKVPTVVVDLPSRGLVYPSGHPLSAGTVEIKYMTAKEEDILATESFIRNGTVIERFLQSLIQTPGVKTDDMLIGDIDAVTVAARVYGYGHDYEVNIETPSGNSQKIIVDLSKLMLNVLEEEYVTKRGSNEFEFTLPSGNVITFKLLTQKDQTLIQNDLKKQNRSNIQGVSTAASTQLKYQILTVNGVPDRRIVNNFIDNFMLAADARALRKHIEKIQPGIDLSVEVVDNETGEPFQASVTIGVRFFWPDARVPN